MFKITAFSVNTGWQSTDQWRHAHVRILSSFCYHFCSQTSSTNDDFLITLLIRSYIRGLTHYRLPGRIYTKRTTIGASTFWNLGGQLAGGLGDGVPQQGPGRSPGRGSKGRSPQKLKGFCQKRINIFAHFAEECTFNGIVHVQTVNT